MPLPRWFDALARTRESMHYSTILVCQFAAFVAIMRLCCEYFLVGFLTRNIIEESILYFSWYWMCFYVFASVLKMTVPGDWTRIVNVVLVGLFLGFFPPVLDVLFGGWNEVSFGIDGFSYQYVTDFPGGWRWSMVSPTSGIPPGEAAVLWAIVLFTGGYVAVRVNSPTRGVLAAILAYAGCVFIAGVMPTAAKVALLSMADRPPGWFALTCVQILMVLVLYFGVFRWRSAGFLLRRSIHLAPLFAVCLIGWSFHMPLTGAVGLPLALVALVAFAALAQNDVEDSEMDQHHRDPSPVNKNDFYVLFVSAGILALSCVLIGRIEGLIALLFLVVSSLYNAEPYRGKRFFPSSYKLEGAWGGAACAIGAAPAARHLMGQQGMWEARPSLDPYAEVVSIAGFVLIVLVVGGWSVLAALKDAKDVEADQDAGIKTVFVLGLARDWSLERTQKAVLFASLMCMAAGQVLQVAIGRGSALSVCLALAGMLMLAWAGWTHARAEERFPSILFAITLYLSAAVVGFHQTVPIIVGL